MQGTSTLLHDPARYATPSQRLANAARIERQRKIARASFNVKQEPETKPYKPFWEQQVEETTIVPSESVDHWAERQKKIPLPELKPEFKEPWFSIVDEFEPLEPRRPSVDQVVRVVAARYGITKIDILSIRRHAKIVRPRMIAIYLARTMTLRSFPEIGRRMGDRDHTTILHSVRKIERLIGSFPAIAAEVESLKAEILSAVS